MKQKQKALKINSRMIAAGLAIMVFGTALLLSTDTGKKILGINIKSSPSYAQTGKFRTAKDPIKDQYIVVLNDNSNPDTEATRLAGQYNSKAKQIYHDALKGFAAKLTDAQAQSISQDPNVQYVEQDGQVKTNGSQSNPGWALDRIDQRPTQLDLTYNYTATGQGVNVYVIDTGIMTTHVEFGGRAFEATSTVGGAYDMTTCNGHGTGVAGVIGANTFGVAKQVKLYSVRVFPCSGYAAVSDVVAGVDWVTRHAVKPAVANMSLGGAMSSTMNSAVAKSTQAGIVYAVAAGNEAMDACYESPSSVPSALTVGAIGNNTGTDTNETIISWSNYGPCVDVFAPGLGVSTVWNGTTNNITTYASGTSFASPIAAGAAALYLETHPTASVAEVDNAVVASATTDEIPNATNGSPNRIIYSLLTGGSTPPPPPPTNDTTAPVVSFTSPKPNYTVRNKDVNVKVSASDASGISQIVITMDGTVLKTCYSLTTCSTTITASTLPAGTHTLTAAATDNAATPNTATTTINIIK